MTTSYHSKQNFEHFKLEALQPKVSLELRSVVSTPIGES
jgi:hypothetical protein